MVDYDFPNDLYVRVIQYPAVTKEPRKIKAEIYRRIEENEEDVIHMKRAGSIWLRGMQKNSLVNLAKKLSDESSWDAHS